MASKKVVLLDGFFGRNHFILRIVYGRRNVDEILNQID